MIIQRKWGRGEGRRGLGKGRRGGGEGRYRREGEGREGDVGKLRKA